ncbi:MAG: S41 family peptidase [Bacteroidales bacterium]|nr:S41 family peptidase [Bacteroidales bacterium]
MKIKNKFNILSSVRNLLLIGILSLILNPTFSQNDAGFETVKNLDIFYSLYKEMDLFYVDEIDPAKTVKTAIDAMLKSLDPYTVYITESEIEDLKFMTTGEYGGIGALIRKQDDYVVISEPYENFPAQEAGLKAGDVIKAIDGRDMKGKTNAEVSELLKGQPNSNVKLSIERPGNDKSLEFVITRKEIKIPSVPYYDIIDDNIGYIRLSSFTNTAHKELKAAYQEMKKDNSLNGLILDLRGNPGGLLMESVKICNLFIDKGKTVVSTKGKVEQWDKTYVTTDNPIDIDIPLVVLVNSISASASEIVSGCFQDLDRAVIIGQRTFGKGLVQTTRDLSYNTKLKVTTAKYYIPSGRCIQTLDYSHRNEDGSVGRVPDSLVSEFKTFNGRSVYDGGGVLPDIEIEPEKISNITISLLTKSLIFDFATLFALENEKIEEAYEFAVTDEVYDEFVDFLADKDYDYETESEEMLKKIIEVVKKEKYYSVAEQELNELEKKLAHDKNKDLQIFKEEISQLLGDEIVHRYYYQKGRIQYAMKFDKDLQTALEVLKDKERYTKILQAQEK